MPYLITIGFLLLITAIYFIAYTVNEKTELPDGTKQRYEEAQTCSGCHAKKSMTIPEEVIFEFKEENSL